MGSGPRPAVELLMIITCGQCQAKFKVAPEQIKETGSKVRCSNCQYVFTVYRPQRPAAPIPEPPAAEARDPLDDLLEAMKSTPENPEADLHDGLGGSGKIRDEADADNLDDLFEDLSERRESPKSTPAERSESPQERRERRRRLYSDLEDEPGKSTFDDNLDDFFDEEADSGDEPSHPPLRRGRGTAAGDDVDDSLEDEFEDLSVADEEDELPEPLEERKKDILGLSADPAHGGAGAAAGAAAAPHEGKTSIRAAESVSGKNSRLFLTLAIVATALLAAVYFMANRPEPMALSTGDQSVEQDGPPQEAGLSDPGGTEGITFTKTNQNHYFRENIKEGTILIITGRVRNSYPERRSFIHLRGRLISADGSTLADRYSYAGNLVSEEELISLPISEIFSRLSIKGGQNGQNMNIEPGKEVPFMLVFDKLPDGMAEYRIDPMGSSPSD
ncbi:hypothetical protein C4J81_07650 [Deltaproteobacteria bacterium Smac51]|nr:hypothetical protein C4J81_07650 [Deltaproteobacteria bacterium Smac51]